MATFSRRDFLGMSVGIGVGTLLAPSLRAEASRAGVKTALICGLPVEKELAAMREAGFDGVECQRWQATPAEAEAGRAVAEKLGMRVHSVMRGCCSLDHPDPDQVKASIGSARQAIRTARLLGADTILLVPCRTGVSGPRPWEYAYTFDPETCLVTQVTRGDNTPFQAYIAAHNHATAASRAAVEQLIPYAAEQGVTIALGNAPNGLWVKPDVFAALVRSFRTPWVKACLGLGSRVRYAPTIEWVEALGHDIATCHVIDARLKPDGREGTWTDMPDGSVDWPRVCRALERCGYNGWLTVESSGVLTPAEKGKRLSLVLA